MDDYLLAKDEHDIVSNDNEAVTMYFDASSFDDENHRWSC